MLEAHSVIVVFEPDAVLYTELSLCFVDTKKFLPGSAPAGCILFTTTGLASYPIAVDCLPFFLLDFHQPNDH